MKTLSLRMIGLLLLLNFNLMAQTNDSTVQNNCPAQLTIFYPIGSNGIQSAKISNNVSLNLFAGYNEGVNGIEIGGFSNTIRHDLQGIQIAGFSNVVLGKSEGIQISGFSNFNKGTYKGCQISGFSNAINDSSLVTQISGFSNLVNGSGQGIQLCGFSNVVNAEFQGVQIAGFSNLTKGKMMGSQISGFSNLVVDTACLVQISGISNMVKGNTNGVQISGFSNVSSGDLTGVQLSGFINMAQKVNGCQIGFINLSDTFESGLPIGFFSYVKNGFRSLDVSYDESQFANLSFNTGTDRFYNIFTVGANFSNNEIIWQGGYGIGTKINLGRKFDLNFEAISYNMYKDYWDYIDQFYEYDDYEYTILNKLRINASWKIVKHLQLFGGISYNVLVSNEKDSEGNFDNYDFIPWTTGFYEGNYNVVNMYPGLNIGIRFTN